jgi:hypothetical protein
MDNPPGVAKPVTMLVDSDREMQPAIGDAISCCGRSNRTVADIAIDNHRARYTENIFITSSPKWLIIFTAIRPLLGRGNGRDVSRYSVAQASSSISAFNVVFSAL